MCKLSDIFSAEELIILDEFVEQALDEAKATLDAHAKDIPLSDSKGSDEDILVDQTEKYLELMEMQRKRLYTLRKLQDKLKEV